MSTILETLALLVIVAASLYLVALALAALFVPAEASRFLLGFAGTRQVHFMELLIRLLVGGSLLIYAPRMFAGEVFGILGWVLVITTACLFLIPWRWHRQFAELAVPRALRYMTLIGLSSLVFGGLILASVMHGGAN